MIKISKFLTNILMALMILGAMVFYVLSALLMIPISIFTSLAETIKSRLDT